MAHVTGKEALMQILRHEGVEYVFGIPGATETHFMDALEDHPEIKYILCLHELTAAGMAEGYARTSGKVGFLNLHTGTGLAAGMPMLSNAYYGGVPMIVTVGQQDTRLLAAEPAMSDNLVRIASPFVKWATEIIHTEDLPMIMRRAFKIATHPPTGPVMVSLPADVLANAFEFEYAPSNHSFTRLHPDDEAIKTAVGLLAAAGNPAIIVEDGVTKNEALSEVVRFAEQIGATVYQPWMSDVNFPVQHPQYLGDIDVTSMATRDILEKVDVLVVIGALFFQQPIYLAKPLVPPATRVIQIDDNPWQIAKNFPIACNVEGNIKVALDDLMIALNGRITAGYVEIARKRIQSISEEKREQEKAFGDRVQKEKDNVPISATRVMQEIRDAIKPATLIVDDCWSYSAVLRRMLPLNELRSYQRARGGGSIGGGLPAAIGAKLAAPDRPVVCVSGDGSALWGIQSLWVASHYNIPVTFIILSNGAYRQVRLMKRKILGEKAKGRDLGTVLFPPQNDFCKIAEGMGLIAEKIEKPEQLSGALKRAISSGKPYLVDVEVDAAL